MPAIPVYRQQVVPNGFGVTPHASGQDPVGVALQNIGQAGEQLGAVLQRRQAVNEDEGRRAWLSSAVSGSHVATDQMLADAQQKVEPGAPGFAKNFLTTFDDYKSKALANAPDETSKRFYAERLDAIRSSAFQRAIGFEAQERTKWKVQQANESIDNISSVASIDPDRAKPMAAEFQTLWGGYEDKAFAQHVNAGMRDKVSRAAVTGMVERDPAQALALMNQRMTPEGEKSSGNMWVDMLDGKELIGLRHRAQSYVSQAENHLRAASDKRLKEAEDATKKLQEFTLTGAMVSPEYEREVKAQTVGTPLEGAAQALVQQSYAGAAFGSQTLPMQQQALRALEAATAQGTDPRTQELLAHARTINRTQEQAYGENPWAAATRFARQPATPVAQIASPEQVPELIRQRAPKMAAIETYAGRPVSPLQPEETKQFLDGMASLAPSARAEVLSQAGGQLSADRINAWAGDMEKSNRPMAIAMKLGYDRTTAGRTTAELVLRGAQALADKSIKKDDVALTGWRAEISKMIRGSLGDARAEDEAIEASYLVRAALDSEGIERPGYSLDASNAQAVKLVVGEVMDRNGVKAILPRGVSESQFVDKLRSFTPEVLGQMIPDGRVYIRGQERNLAQLSGFLYHMGYKRDGSGKYVPSSGGAFVTLDKEGQVPLRLEMR